MENSKNRFVFEYEVLSTGTIGEFSVIETDEETARMSIVERVADVEFTEESDIVIRELIKVIGMNSTYDECESCT